MIVLTLPYPPSANAYWGTRIVKPHGKPAMAMVYVTHEARGYKADVARSAPPAASPSRCRAASRWPSACSRIARWTGPGASAQPRRRPGTTPCAAIDLDNANKVLLDALKGIAFEDDKWVRRLQSERMEPDEHGARVIVAIEQLAIEQPQGDLLQPSVARACAVSEVA
jgi:crossover junction endodeoxyribonuclease RusA